MTTVELDVGKVEEFGAEMASFINGGAAALMPSIAINRPVRWDGRAPTVDVRADRRRGGSPRALCAG